MTTETTPPLNHETFVERMGEAKLRQRLLMQQDHEAGRAWQGKGLFKFEHTINFPALVSFGFKCLGLYGRGYRNFLDIRVVEREVFLKNLPEAFDGLRVLQIADLHADLDPNLPDAVIQALKGVEYDLCLNTGDFRNRTRDPFQMGCMEPARRIYEHIHGPSYGVLGNHDFIQIVPELEAMGMQVLLNETVAIEKDGQQLWLSGIDDAHFYQSHDVERTRASIPEGACAIMLSHSPDTYREVAEAGYAWMLSGHTHGGQICLPGGIMVTGHSSSPRSHWRGGWAFEGLQGYTSPGSGAGAAPLRFNCPPELTLHVLKRQD